MAYSGFRPLTISNLAPAQPPTPPTPTIALLNTLVEKLTLPVVRLYSEPEIPREQEGFSFIDDPHDRNNDLIIAEGLEFLTKQRNTSLYQTWLTKLNNPSALTNEDILAFSLITDNINLLTLEMISRLTDYNPVTTTAFHTFERHINALLYAMRMKDSRQDSDKQGVFKNLEKQLYARLTDGPTISLCNLAGIDLHGLTLQNSLFRWINLNGANLSRTTFHDFTFRECSLNQANFDCATTFYALKSNGLTLKKCSVENAKFTHSKLALMAKGTRFDASSFNKASINATFDACSLKKCTFFLANIDENTQFNDVCRLSGSDFSSSTELRLSAMFEDSKVILFTQDELYKPDSLKIKLNKLMPPETLTPERLSQYRTRLASILLEQLKAESDRAIQVAMINAALTHDIFKSQNTLKWAYNSIISTMSLFGSTQTIKTTAEIMLEEALVAPNQLAKT